MGKTYIDTDSIREEKIKAVKVQLSSLYGKFAQPQGKTYMVPKEMEVSTRIGVTVWTMSKQQVDKKYFETESLLSATRIVNTFKPKRNHKIVKVEFEEVGALV